MDDNLVPFTTILAIEGTPTSDGRLLQLGGMSTRQVPLPIMAQMVNPEAGGHTGSVLVGKIENIESDGERVMGKGVIDTNTEYGKRVVDLLKSQTLRFVSIDIGAAEFEQDDSPEAVAPMVFTNYEVMGATIVPFPALPGAVIWLDGTDEPPEMTRFTPLFDKVRSLGFNPDQERDENGRWGSGSGKSYDWKDKIKLEIGEPEYKSKKHTETEEEIAYLLQEIEEGVPNEDGVMESLGDQGIHENENNIDELNKVIANFQAQEIIEPTRDAIVAEFKKYSDQIYVELDSSGASDSQYITVYPFSEEKALAAIDDIGTIEFLAPEQDIKIRISDHELPIGYADPGGDIVLFTKDMGGGGEAAMIGDFDPERVVEKVLTKFDVKPNNLTAAFNPDQERDENGRWGSSGSKSNAIKSATGDKKQSNSSDSAKEKIIADLMKTPEERKAEWGSTKKEVFGSLRERFPDVEFKGERSKHTLDELTAAAAGIALVVKEFPAVIGSIDSIVFANGRGGTTLASTVTSEEGIDVKFVKQPEDVEIGDNWSAIEGPNDVMAFGTAVHEMFHVGMNAYTVNYETIATRSSSSSTEMRLIPMRGPIGSEGEFSSIRDFRKDTIGMSDPERTGLKFEPVSRYGATDQSEAAAEGLSYSMVGFPKDKNEEVSQKVFDLLKESKPIKVFPSEEKVVQFSNGSGVRVPVYFTDWQERKADGMVASIGEQNDFETLSLVQTTEFVEGTWIWDFVHAANSLTAAFNPDQERDENGKWTSDGGASEPKTGKVDISEIVPNADLSDRDLSGMYLRGMDLTSVRLTNANLFNADLRGANLSGAHLYDVNLSRANLDGANLTGARLEGANLLQASLFNANLSGAYMHGADLERASMNSAIVADADLTGAELSNANLSGADLSGANLSDATLEDADLSGADLPGANLDGADLSGADLSNANLTGANLTGADLRSADLSNADLSYAMLQDTKMNGANLSNANFTGADLIGANTTGADMAGAILRLDLDDQPQEETNENKEEDTIALEGVASAIKEELGKKDVDVRYEEFEEYDYSAEIYNNDGSRMGNMSFSVNDGTLVIGLIQISDQYQGEGTAKVIQQAVINEALDDKNGIDFVSFHANISHGGYAWAETAYPTQGSWGTVQGFVGEQIKEMKETDEGKKIDFSNVEKALESEDPRSIQIIHDDKTLLPDSLVTKSTKGNELGRELLLDSDWYAIMPTNLENLANAQSRLAASGAIDRSSWMPDVPERDLSEWLPWPCYVREDGSVTDEGIWEDFSDAKRTKDFSYWPVTLAFSPDQERDENGKWTSGGGSGSEPVSELLDSVASGEKIEIRPDQVSIVLAEMAKKSNEGKDFNACEISVPGTNLFCEDHVGTERADMPQIKGTAREGSDAEKIADKHGKVDGTEAFRESLKASGIAVKDIDSVPVVSLKASQTELIGSKVGGMMKAIEHGKIDLQDERIFVSKDGYILDGHHRWAAAIGVEAKDGKLNDNDITMNVTRVDANIRELIPLANEFAADFGIIPKPGA